MVFYDDGRIDTFLDGTHQKPDEYVVLLSSLPLTEHTYSRHQIDVYQEKSGSRIDPCCILVEIGLIDKVDPLSIIYCFNYLDRYE